METQTRARHRLGGKHSDPIVVPIEAQKKPSGRRSAALHPVVVPPPVPDHAPTVHEPKTEPVVMTPMPGPSFDPKTMPVVDPVKAQTGRLSIIRHRKPLTALAAITTGGLLLVGGGAAVSGFATPVAKSETKNGRHLAAKPSDLEYENNPITVPNDVVLQQEKILVRTEPAPLPEPEPVKPEPVIVAAPAPKPVVVAPKPVTPAAVAPAPKPATTVSSGKAAIIASAALGQIGVMQDCTMLVTNSLAAVGIRHHGWPVSYYGLGHAISAAEAVPGDLIYYVNGSGPGSLAHIAVYIGNGQAVHGGWNGNETRVFSVNVGSGPNFIRVTA